MQNASAKCKVNFGKNVVHPSSLHLSGTTSGTRQVSLTSNSSSGGGGSTNQGSAADGKRQRANAPKTLDGFMFLDCCRGAYCVVLGSSNPIMVCKLFEFPDELIQAVLSGLHINNVVAENLLFFSNLTRLDMSDNEAQLEPFGCLPALIELDFQCNAVQNLSIANGFLNLEDAEELSNLLRIRELYLSNNWIRLLPPIMDRFSRLETLSLEQKNIVGEEILSFLSIVPRLRSLNLSHNKITGFPESGLILEEKRGAGFYNLLYLSLACKSITTEDAVVFTCELHSLRKPVLYGNPLAHAAVMSHDQTELAYDPAPTMPAHIAERGLPLEILLAYPETKWKKRTAMSSYGNVEIYKMIPNELPLQQPFQTKATNYLLAESDTKRERPDLEVAVKPTIRRATDESALCDQRASVPTFAPVDLARRLGALSNEFATADTRSLGTLTANRILHSEVGDCQRQRPRHPSDERLSLHESSFPSAGVSSGSSSSIHHKHKGTLRLSSVLIRGIVPPDVACFYACIWLGPRGVDDALAELSEQVASKNCEKRANGERNVDLAMDSLVATAQKINLVYQHPR
ncbi:hypothetical protein FI667_g2501, partial [Globisporangium splendens]